MERISALSDDNYQLCAHDDSTGRRLTLLLTRTGLTMHKLTVESGQFPARDVLCGPESSSSFKMEGRKFMNQVVGRYANRLPAGKIHLVDSSREASKKMELNLDQNGKLVLDHSRKKISSSVNDSLQFNRQKLSKLGGGTVCTLGATATT